MKIRTLIVDDEPLARKLIRRFLANESAFQIIGECSNGIEALHAIQNDAPHLVFMDVQMPEMGGFDVLSGLDPSQIPVIIFVTAHDMFALKAFEAHALDYLLKPLDDERFHQALQRVRTYIEGTKTGGMRERLMDLVNDLPHRAKPLIRLAVKNHGHMVFLRIAEIDWIEAVGNYLKIHVGEQRHLLRGRLSELEKKLPAEQFFRIHRSTIVNWDRVKEFRLLFKGEGLIVLRNGTQLSASRTCCQKLQEVFDPEL